MSYSLSMAKQKSPKRDLYQEITDRILAALESGTAPWLKPWKVSPYGSVPHNPVSGTIYRGINVWLTLLTQWERGYDIPMWLTFKQAHEIAAKAARKAGHKVEAKQVGRGKKRTVYVYADGPNKGKSVGGIREGQNAANQSGGTTVIFWTSGTRTEEDENGEEQRRQWMTTRAYTVFNVAQCDEAVQEYLCPPVAETPEFTPLEQCERICDGFAIRTDHGGDRACYVPSEDRIRLPKRERFNSPEEYYTTRFHEMGHATGHPSRLARFKVGEHREVHTYAEEELVAEFTACFLAGEAGIVRTVENNSAAYLNHWASKLKEDKRIAITAAQRAQKAADLILGRQPSEGTGNDSGAAQEPQECEAA